MPDPSEDRAAPAPDRGWKIASAILVAVFAVAVCWFVQWRSAPPPPPAVKLPYEPPPAK